MFSWRDDRALAPPAIAAADVVTIDLFDTLLLRRCGSPQGLHEAVARRALASGALANAEDVGWYPALRRRAEAVARQRAHDRRGSHEVTLAEIHAAIPAWIGDGAKLAEIEIEEDRDQIVGNPPMIDLLRHLARRGARVLILSDTYYQSSEIDPLMSLAGIDADLWADRLLSCEHGCSKSDGGLFRRALERFPDATPDRVLHIGDDPHADIGMAASFGIRTLHYAVSARFREMLDREEIVGIEPDGRTAMLRTLASHRRPTDDPALDFWFDAGLLLLGPVVEAFAAWVVADCVARGIRRIAPFLREGAIFATAMRRHAAAMGADLDIRPLAVSRQSLHLPTLESFDDGAIRQIASSSVFRTLDDLLAAHGLDDLPPDLAVYRTRPVVELMGLVDGAHEDVFQSVLLNLTVPGTVARVSAEAAAQRRLLLAYLAEELGDAGAVATVDFGARASTQQRLDRLPELRAAHSIDHYLFYGIASLVEPMLRDGPVHLFMPVEPTSLESAQAVHRSPQFLETCLNGIAGTTIGYRETADGRVIPVEGSTPSGADASRLNAVQAGILAFLDTAAILPVRSDGPDEAIRRTVFGLMHRAVALPTPEEAREFGSLLYDYGDHHRTPRLITDAPARATVARLGPIGQPYLLKSAVLARAAELPWAQGAITEAMPDHLVALFEGAAPGYGHRLFCRLLIRDLLAAGNPTIIVVAAGGDGGMGPTFIRLGRAAGIVMAGYIDHFADRVGAQFHGLPVLRLAELDTAEHDAFAVISTGFGHDLSARLSQLFERDGRVPRLFLTPVA